MAWATWKQTIGYRDNNGDVGKVTFWIGQDEAVATAQADIYTIAVAVGTQLAAMTTGKPCFTNGYLAWTDPSQYGTGDQYASVHQKARLMFLTNTRSRTVALSIPAPLVDIFYNGGTGTKGDEMTVTPTAGAALLAALQTTSNGAIVVAGPASQDGIHSFIRGSFVERRGGRKLTRWKKSPDGTGPA